ncbi:MAG: Phospho-N-acetylmuramoyl-pentapeptide-transferase [candidate division WWE3 bacterium GW2011_GWB1_44_4]|uniref:Phospho-N-acetylmuramoyl-pentapeptide-transferase n=1 Tax=candidate division WWE3 bacterium GW2011_GWB1_44_4 TaxID=1619116 RepID=A0A0G1MD75_UNCKA|nr:MAG: Phospho-N-acetylmuramoyl-pentapeptide-transferase [candidate division WWE3 bacterium GW2011_GWB1_44_4]
MEIQLVHLFFAAIISVFLYPVWIKFVYRYQMGEAIRTDGPQSHLVKKGTPTMGGLVFVLTVGVVTFLLNRSRTQTLFPLFVASLAGFFGLIEDLSKVYKRSGLPGFFAYHFGSALATPPIIVKAFQVPWRVFTEFWRVVGSNADAGIKTHQKFLIQACIAGFVSYWTYFKLGWDYIWFPLIGDVHIGWGYPLVIFFLFTAVLNFVAFTDGLDGLAGGVLLFAFAALGALAFTQEHYDLAAFTGVIVGALLAFLWFNIYPARFFMGELCFSPSWYTAPSGICSFRYISCVSDRRCFQPPATIISKVNKKAHSAYGTFTSPL